LPPAPHRICASHGPSMLPAQCRRRHAAARTRDSRRPERRLGISRDEQRGARLGDQDCRGRPLREDRVHSRACHHGRRPRADRSWYGRGRDRAPGSACRQQTASGKRRRARRAVPARALATRPLHQPNWRGLNDPARRLAGRRFGFADKAEGDRSTLRRGRGREVPDWPSPWRSDAPRRAPDEWSRKPGSHSAADKCG
jgi:hypothetical protein